MRNDAKRGAKHPEPTKTVAQAAKELRQDFASLGYYRSDNYTRVFGDPRTSVEVKAGAQLCAAYLPGKKSGKF